MELEIFTISEDRQNLTYFHSTKAVGSLKSLIYPIDDEIYSALDAYVLIELPCEERIWKMVGAT